MRGPREIAQDMAELGREMGKSRMEMAQKRKNEFLHTRVSETLKAKVKQRAEEMGIPTSILIRNILDAYFNLSKEKQDNFQKFDVNISDNLKNVSGFQKFMPVKQQPCSSCGRDINKGDKAFRGVNDSGEFLDIHCDVCVSEFLS